MQHTFEFVLRFHTEGSFFREFRDLKGSFIEKEVISSYLASKQTKLKPQAPQMPNYINLKQKAQLKFVFFGNI